MPSGGSAPTPPDPTLVAGLQSTNTKNLFDYQNSQNRVNYNTTTGSSGWTKTPVFDEQGYNQALEKHKQALFNAQQADRAGNLPVTLPGTYSPEETGLQASDQLAAQQGQQDATAVQGYQEYLAAPSRDDYTTYEWSANSQLNPGEQAVYDANLGTRQNIAKALTSQGGNILANARPTDYSGVAPLQYADKMGAESLYDTQQNSLIDLGNNYTPQMVGDFSGAKPSYSTMDGNYNIGTFNGGPNIRDWGALVPGFLTELTNRTGTATGGLENAAGRFSDRGDKYSERESSMRDWASMLAPQLQGLNSQMTEMNPWEYDQIGADAMYRQSMRYTEPQWQDDRKMIEARLGEQGFVPGTPAYENALKQMLDSQAMERDQARDKSLLAGREYGNQAFDNRSGNIQNAIANLLGFGDLGVRQDTAKDQGDLGFAELGRDYGALEVDALGKAGDLQLGVGELALGAGKLGLDSDTARADQSLDTFDMNRRSVLDQFGMDKDKTGFNNDVFQQGFQDDLESSRFNLDAANVNNDASSQWVNDFISGQNSNIRATADNNAANSQRMQDVTDLYGMNNQITQTNNDARAQGLNEADRVQQGDLNWLLDILKSLGNPATAPDPMTAGTGGNMQGADIASLFGDQFKNQMAGYNADVSSDNATTSALASIFAAWASTGFAGSDRRIKADIIDTGTFSPKGYPWYKFRYVWDAPGTQREGVMAQDILAASGDGVVTHPLGFYMVDYSKV